MSTGAAAVTVDARRAGVDTPLKRPACRRWSAGLNKRHKMTAAAYATPAFGRDTGYLCDACRTVVWDPMLREHQPVWKFCPCCGSELMLPGAQVSYSDAAHEQDESLYEKIRALARDRRGAMVQPPVRRTRTSATELMRNGRDKDKGSTQSAAMKTTTKLLAKELLRTKPSIKRRTHHVRSKKRTALDLLQRLKEGRLQGQSRHCDVCGYAGPEVKCCTCPSSFHKICLGMQEDEDVGSNWTCHTCNRKEIERSPPSSDSTEMLPMAETARTRWKPPSTPMQCSSCGYHETEAMNCGCCSRWFCFACMCLSVATLPLSTWNCPECVGQDRYDEERRKLIEASRRRVAKDKVTAKEQDGFSQLVFDLSCTCNWDEWERNIDTLIELARRQLQRDEIPSVMPFHSLHYARKSNGDIVIDKMMIREISERYSRDAKERAYIQARVKARDDAEDFQTWKFDRLKFAPNEPARRLRIGYLSSDFVDHPTADLIQSALLKHDRARFEIFCYSISREDDSEYRKTLSQKMEHFTHFPRTLTDRKCAELIAADGIHILVNLNGHTAGDRNGISALRPAPIQLVYLAYPGTMGADYVDYNVTDKVVCPDSHEECYSERLLYMPHCYQTNSFRELYADVLNTSTLPSRGDHQLPDDPTFVFCNFCRLGRITPDLFAAWMRILKRVPDSVIWLYKHPKAAVSRLQSQASKAGVESERLIFGSPCSPKLEHLKRVTLADLALDTLVYNGHTTASDMLWAGVPLITMCGDNWPSRVAACIAESCEMRAEMVVESLQEYEERAVELAQNPNKLKKVRAKLAKKRLTAPLFDSQRWISNFELGLDEVWRRYAANEQQDSNHLIVKDIKVTNGARLRLVEEVHASRKKGPPTPFQNKHQRAERLVAVQDEVRGEVEASDDSLSLAATAEEKRAESPRKDGLHGYPKALSPASCTATYHTKGQSPARKVKIQPDDEAWFPPRTKPEARVQKGRKLKAPTSITQRQQCRPSGPCKSDSGSTSAVEASVSAADRIKYLKHGAQRQVFAAGRQDPSGLLRPQIHESKQSLCPAAGAKHNAQKSHPVQNKVLTSDVLTFPLVTDLPARHEMHGQANAAAQSLAFPQMPSTAAADAITYARHGDVRQPSDLNAIESECESKKQERVVYLQPRVGTMLKTRPEVDPSDPFNLRSVKELIESQGGVPRVLEPEKGCCAPCSQPQGHPDSVGPLHSAMHDQNAGHVDETCLMDALATFRPPLRTTMHDDADPLNVLAKVALVGDSTGSRGQFLDPQSRAPNHAAGGHRSDAVFRLGGHDISKFGGVLSAHPCSTQSRITRDSGEGMPSVDRHIFGGATLVPTGPRKPHMIQKIEKGESWQSSEHLAPGDLLLGIDDVDVTLFSLQDIQAKLGKHQSIVKLTLARNHVRTQVTIRRLDSRQIRFEYPGSYGHQIPPHTQPQQHSVVGPSERIHPAGGQATPRMQSFVNLGEIVRGQRSNPYKHQVVSSHFNTSHDQVQMKLAGIVSNQQHELAHHRLVASESPIGAVGAAAGAPRRNQASQHTDNLNTIKDAIKTRVRAVCNDEYRMHYRRQSATPAVKNHLKQVALIAQTKFLTDITKRPQHQSMDGSRIEDLQEGLRHVTEQNAFEYAVAASKHLIPSFHWISQMRPRE